MKEIRIKVAGFATALAFNCAAFAAAPTADIAILLDTSGSMDGLITQVRDGLWKTLNSLGDLEKDGEKARLRLALYEYGSGVVTAEANFIQLLTPLTTDHTLLAQALFATKALGGSEYSGMAIDLAASNLAWTKDLGDFKSIVIAGNETIKQGSVEALGAAQVALEKDILVNTIFAGPQTYVSFPRNGGGFGCQFFCTNPTPTPQLPSVPSDPQVNPIFLEWKELANTGGGEVLNIDHNQSQPYIESPFDEEIVSLTASVNETFLPFGELGRNEFQRMVDLDQDIRNSGSGSYMDWGTYRGGSFGQATQSTWDLVSAVDTEEFDLESIKESDLPELLKNKTLEEKRAIIISFKKKREAIEGEITALKLKRSEFVEQRLQDLGNEGEKTFSDAIKAIILKQLQDKGFDLSTSV